MGTKESSSSASNPHTSETTGDVIRGKYRNVATEDVVAVVVVVVFNKLKSIKAIPPRLAVSIGQSGVKSISRSDSQSRISKPVGHKIESNLLPNAEKPKVFRKNERIINVSTVIV